MYNQQKIDFLIINESYWKKRNLEAFNKTKNNIDVY